MLALLVRPKFWPGHLAMLVCVAIAAGLGLWQLDAWSQHRADAARDLAHEPAVALSSVMSGDSPFPGRSLGRPVSFSGTWLTEDTVYVIAKKKVVINGGTSFSEWSASGIKHGTPGTWIEHAAMHATPGPDQRPVPQPRSVCWDCMMRAAQRAAAVSPRI